MGYSREQYVMTGKWMRGNISYTCIMHAFPGAKCYNAWYQKLRKWADYLREADLTAEQDRGCGAGYRSNFIIKSNRVHGICVQP